MQVASRPHVLGKIPSGMAGTRATLRLMANLVKAYRVEPAVRNLAIQLTHVCEPKAWACEIQQIQRFVRDRIRYVRDVRSVETLQTPVETLRIEAGDCDDKAVLTAALAESIGFRTIFWAVQDPTGQWHVLPGAQLGRGYVPMETIFPNIEAGWFPPDPLCVYPFHVS